MPRVNRAVELLSERQPVYSTVVVEPSYQRGQEHAKTWADCLTLDLEHHPFEPAALHAFMRGLVDGGPTRSGHRTPAVIVTLPIDGNDERTVRANSWMIKQALAAGVHGLLLCHAETPAAVKAFVEAARYPFQSAGVGAGLDQGRRGAGGQALAAPIWGLGPDAYLDRADVWPLNPAGELMLGLKVENLRALDNAEASLAIPGIAFAEWGPGDMGMAFGHKDAHDPALSARDGGGAGAGQSRLRSGGGRVPGDGPARQRAGAARRRRPDRRRDARSRRDRPAAQAAAAAPVMRSWAPGVQASSNVACPRPRSRATMVTACRTGRTTKRAARQCP